MNEYDNEELTYEENEEYINGYNDGYNDAQNNLLNEINNKLGCITFMLLIPLFTGIIIIIFCIASGISILRLFN